MPIAEIHAYYDNTYRFLVDAEEEDDLYAVEGNDTIFRSEHQANVCAKKLSLSDKMKVLDFGCAKGATLRHLVRLQPGIQPYVFEVSASYKNFWDAFVPEDNQAIFKIKPQWLGTLDVVLSFFTLEHIADARQFIQTVASLLKDGGQLYVVVPNMYENIGDLIVVDHINHFSPTSLELLFSKADFSELEIDDRSHKAAFIVRAVKGRRPNRGKGDAQPNTTEVEQYVGRAEEIARYWNNMRKKICRFEREHAEGKRAAIYGSGVYGAFIASTLENIDQIECFLDQNPHKYNKTLFDKDIRPPTDLASDVEIVYVGLNPNNARRIIDDVQTLHAANRKFLFL
ncbi:MAG: methyltransferase domain-containing protein [Alphaproteobacteria bacterium]